MPPINPAGVALLTRAVNALGSANYGGWQKDEEEMARILGSLGSSNDVCLPLLTEAQLDLLIRGVGALGTNHYNGWQEDEKKMRNLLYRVRGWTVPD